ncbi:sigma-70 family RNA polymerase sigma factor [Streptomyces piniterrae]|uniref:Sigma-70 family RNA polymerase sigma factor n=1 Tax=Streptomyces piniterrae TaxID=2571125 RepID=A0A4U0MNF4_9ACTN|nr:sigma-70 family RNA polymerase sigma factor [Streptomyces piniterrae]TJZ42311.1 sigma-70 family RNA polymerase sigma factor [Streptomyces piniterrae]
MGVDGRDERRGGETGASGQPQGPSSGQVPGQTGPMGATSPASGSAGRNDRAEGRQSHSVPAQRERSGGVGPVVPADFGDVELPPSDGQLIADMRAGDDSAYEEMYRRHAAAVRRYARSCCRDTHTAEDLTGEVFARTLQAVRGGAGPDTAVRAYLLTTVRRVAASWAKTAKREQLVEDFAVFAVTAAGSSMDGDTLDLGADVRAMHEAEQSMAVQAFRSLPERYQTVLWHTTIEDESPSQVAPLLGLTANATAVLAHRAREGLKQAYLQAHVSQSLTSGGDCARYADRLGAYARGGLRMRAERGLRKHLDECARCRTAALEVADVNERIGAVLPVAVVGWFAAGYAVKAAAVGVAGAAAGAGAAAAAGGAGSGTAGSAGGAAVSEGLGAPVKVGVGVGMVAAAGAALALVLISAPRPAPHTEAEPSRPAPSSPPAPRKPSPKPTQAGAEPSAPPAAASRQEPAPKPPAPTSKPTVNPAPPKPTPTPTPPESTPTPPKPTPKPPPPSPAPTPYRVNALDYDFAGDGTKPEVRAFSSTWMWQRQQPRVDGRAYPHGVSVHGSSSVLIDLNRKCTSYDAFAGVDDLSLGLGALRFSVYGDGERLWRSGVVRGGEPAVPVHVPLDGRKTLRLVVEPQSPADVVALGDWAQSQISC